MPLDFRKQRINADELKEAVEEDSLKVIEVLPEDHYVEGHIPKAINIPPNKFAKLASQILKKDDRIVVYCEDITCLTSPFAARWLRERGYKNVLDFEGGKADWKAAGHPLKSGKTP